MESCKSRGKKDIRQAFPVGIAKQSGFPEKARRATQFGGCSRQGTVFTHQILFLYYYILTVLLKIGIYHQAWCFRRGLYSTFREKNAR